MHFFAATMAGDAAKMIAIATPEFVKVRPTCLADFCSIRVRSNFDKDEAVVKHLLTNGASRLTDVLHNSVATYRPRLIKVLLKNGFDVNERNLSGRTPLDTLAMMQKKCDVYNVSRAILIDAGGELYAKQNHEIQSLIEFRKNARIVAITCIGIGRKRREIRDVFAIIARIVWGERIKKFI